MRFTKLALICLAIGLAGCTFIQKRMGSSASDPALQAQAENAGQVGGVGADGNAALKLDSNQFMPADPLGGKTGRFKVGVSSETVEKIAKQQGCDSDLGAALVSDSGPIEKYRINCRDGSIFLARCELHQCTAVGN